MRFPATPLTLIPFLMALAASPARAQVEVLAERPGPREIVGSVVEAGSGRGVPTVDVVLRDSVGGVVAAVVGDLEGGFGLRPPAAGVFQLTVGRIGYAAATGTVAFPDRGTVAVRVGLTLAPVTLEGVEAVGRVRPRSMDLTLEGFEARRREGGGTFFTTEQIERYRPTRITDLLQRVPGVEVLRVGGQVVDIRVNNAQGVTFQGVGRPCLPTIWLDGVRVREGGIDYDSAHRTSFLNDVIPPEQIGGIEVYTHLGRIPARFRDSSSVCGVVAVWSRR